MRIILLLLILCLLGCDSRHTKAGLDDVVLDDSGNHKLVVERIRSQSPGGQGYGIDWTALVWMVKQGGEWTEKRRITQDDFQSGSNRRRWIVEVDRFDPDAGTAIVKIAEGDAPFDAERVRYNYSWREWNLLTNGEIRVIRVCKDTLEKF